MLPALTALCPGSTFISLFGFSLGQCVYISYGSTTSTCHLCPGTLLSSLGQEGSEQDHGWAGPKSWVTPQGSALCAARALRDSWCLDPQPEELQAAPLEDKALLSLGAEHSPAAAPAWGQQDRPRASVAAGTAQSPSALGNGQSLQGAQGAPLETPRQGQSRGVSGRGRGLSTFRKGDKDMGWGCSQQTAALFTVQLPQPLHSPLPKTTARKLPAASAPVTSPPE